MPVNSNKHIIHNNYFIDNVLNNSTYWENLISKFVQKFKKYWNMEIINIPYRFDISFKMLQKFYHWISINKKDQLEPAVLRA